MNTSDFYYELPEELIAQTPIKKRDESRLMLLDKNTGEIKHRHFYNIIDELCENDCLVLNDSKVLPARLYGEKEGTGGKIEFVLLTQKDYNKWEVILKPGKRAKKGAKFIFGNGLLRAEIIEVKNDGNRIAEFSYDGNFFEILDKIGSMPLPPYITEKLDDKDRYQTVYARERGSAAAPTAGLHFTPELIEKIKQRGVKIAYVTLHVGLGTFRPVKEEKIENHHMHSEHFSMSCECAQIINDTKKNGGRIVCVGTTSCRTVESVYKKYGKICECDDWTDIFIYPGYKFCVLDALITNFHLPESTLIMLVSALAGRENVLNAYECAVREKYRFFSFGDAMFIR